MLVRVGVMLPSLLRKNELMRRYTTPVLVEKAFVTSLSDKIFQEKQTPSYTCYEKLWRSVLGQLIIDACNNSKKVINKKIKQEAINFLLTDEKDFPELCILADIDPCILGRN